MEGSTGLDTEFTVAGEPFPAIIFGYVPGPTSTMNGYAGTPAAGYHPASNTSTSYCIQSACWRLPSPALPNGTGKITGVVDAVKVYVPAAGGLPNGGQVWGGLNGGKIDQPIKKPWVVLNDLTSGDTRRVGRAGRQPTAASRSLDVPDRRLPAHLLGRSRRTTSSTSRTSPSATARPSTSASPPLTGWWTVYEGYVFNDTNRNSVRDPGEARRQPNYGPLTLASSRQLPHGSRDDRRHHGPSPVTTRFESAYPLTQWIVPGGLQRHLVHDRRYVPSGQPGSADHGAGRRCRRERAPDHRPRWNVSTGVCTPTTRTARPTGLDLGTAGSWAP